MDLEEVLSLLFETAEATEEQRTAMEQALDEYHVVYKNGRIYHQPSRQELLKKLRRAPSVCRLRGLPQEIVEQMPAPEAEPVVRIPIHNTAAGILQRAGALMDLNRDVLKALSEGFTLLVDESVFLADEGRKMLEQKILPFLKDSKTKLFVDESVIATLFRQFRRSVPYTELELSEIEPELRDELQELRRETHRNCKAAIKVVRALRQNRCLEVVASLTDSDYSYENIYQVAERNPQSRFSSSAWTISWQRSSRASPAKTQWPPSPARICGCWCTGPPGRPTRPCWASSFRRSRK